MMQVRIRLAVRLASAVASTVVFLAACGSAPPQTQSAADASSPGVGAAAARDGGSNRCALLTDSEVQAVIGPHGPGTSGIENEYGLQSCRWTATATPQGPGVPDGWLDSIEVAVFDKDKESWAREQTRGEPISGIDRGARYDATYGQLWFDCAAARFCMVKARTAIETKRQDIARRLAGLVQSRVK